MDEGNTEEFFIAQDELDANNLNYNIQTQIETETTQKTESFKFIDELNNNSLSRTVSVSSLSDKGSVYGKTNKHNNMK